MEQNTDLLNEVLEGIRQDMFFLSDETFYETLGKLKNLELSIREKTQEYCYLPEEH